ncbi:MAG: FkbM family methyltransferase [Nitrospira sp.]|nr:FkbM family methyltransferase [Nitrospira sp.]
MDLLSRIATSAAWRLTRWADRRRVGAVDGEIFHYEDCLATIQTVNKFITANRLCDIGAYKGHWSFVMQQLNAQLQSVVMFEPQAKWIGHLQERKLGGIKKKIYQCALSDREQKTNLIGGTASASLYETAESQHHYFPGSANQESEMVDVKVLDDVYAKDNLEYPDLIKMDVQGYELNVLRGARTVLSHARYLVIELSFREFYKGQPPLWELWRFLDEQHYVMVDHGYELRARTSPYELLQVDAIFMNTQSELS